MIRARSTTVAEDEARIEFAKAAAKSFAKDARVRTFNCGNVEPGCLLALRWGMGDDCVLVLKLDEDFMPVLYQQIVEDDA